MINPVHDKVYEQIVVPVSCSCCNKCWLIVGGSYPGRCVWGGPYNGYVELKENGKSESNNTE